MNAHTHPADVFTIIGRKLNHSVTIEKHTLADAFIVIDALREQAYNVYLRRVSNRVAK